MDIKGDSEKSLKVCRICFAGETEISSDAKELKNEVLLKQICNCKGSMKYVHETCLIKWLQTKNIKFCELCLQEYDISYEFGSLKEITMNGLKYAFKDKRKLLRGMLYSLYLWIFFRRFMHMIISIFKFVKTCVSSSIRSIQARRQKTTRIMIDLLTVLRSPQLDSLDHFNWEPSVIHWLTNKNQFWQTSLKKFKDVLSVHSMLRTFIGLISFLYRVFIFVQMCCLGYGESLRIKKYINFMLINSRKIKIN